MQLQILFRLSPSKLTLKKSLSRHFLKYTWSIYLLNGSMSKWTVKQKIVQTTNYPLCIGVGQTEFYSKMTVHFWCFHQVWSALFSLIALNRSMNRSNKPRKEKLALDLKRRMSHIEKDYRKIDDLEDLVRNRTFSSSSDFSPRSFATQTTPSLIRRTHPDDFVSCSFSNESKLDHNLQRLN